MQFIARFSKNQLGEVGIFDWSKTARLVAQAEPSPGLIIDEPKPTSGAEAQTYNQMSRRPYLMEVEILDWSKAAHNWHKLSRGPSRLMSRSPQVEPRPRNIDEPKVEGVGNP